VIRVSGNMVRAWDGTLPAAEFEKAVVHLVKVWEQQCPNSPPWTWQRRQQNPVISPLAHVSTEMGMPEE
jgi:hypothetical protein